METSQETFQVFVPLQSKIKVWVRRLSVAALTHYFSKTFSCVPVADWTVSSCLLFLDMVSSAMVDVFMLHIIRLFYVKETVVLYYGYYNLQIIFPVDINKTIFLSHSAAFLSKAFV